MLSGCRSEYNTNFYGMAMPCAGDAIVLSVLVIVL